MSSDDKSAFSRERLTTAKRMGERVTIPRVELLVEREAGQASSRVLVLDADLFRIGSHPSNELVLNDPLVSRFHCRIARGPHGWTLTDNRSMNGTSLGGVRVRDADLPLPDCRLELGDSVVRVRELSPAGEADVPVWPSFGQLYGVSMVMRRMFGVLDRLARTDVNVLIEGESGTGKELVATEIVRRGARADGPFLIVDCGAISPNLIESELFGHTKGAFTGAERERIGAFEAADGGTVFLDEIGEMPLEMQPKLLRALDAREIRRIGENRSRKIDVRVIAATNRTLEREVNSGRFREDLYFRLSVVTVRVPPLRERLDDLGILIDVFLNALNAQDSIRLFTPEVLAELSRHDWPGNVRELRNFVERTVVLDAVGPASSREAADALSRRVGAASGLETADLEVPFTVAKDQLIAVFEQRYLTALLEWAGGNISRAARKAGMDRMYLYRLVQKHGLRGGSSIKD